MLRLLALVITLMYAGILVYGLWETSVTDEPSLILASIGAAASYFGVGYGLSLMGFAVSKLLDAGILVGLAFLAWLLLDG